MRLSPSPPPSPSREREGCRHSPFRLEAGWRQRPVPGYYDDGYRWYMGDMARSFSTIPGRMETT